MSQQGTSFVSGSIATHVQAFSAALRFLIGRAVFTLSVNKRPDFVALDSPAGKIAENLVLVFRAGATKIAQQFHNRCAVDSGHPRDSTKGVSLDQSGDYL